MDITKANEPIYQKANGTYVMTRAETGDLDYWCGFPDDPDGCHTEVAAYLAEHPEALIPEPVPPPPSPEELAQRERERIIAALEAIDRKAVRPLRAITAGSTSEMDRALIEELEVEAVGLRVELAKL